jgi:hypothetical protein
MWVSATTVKMLEAAVEIAGGTRELADRLGISESLLAAFLADSRPLPDALLLRTVDLILEDRQSRIPGLQTAELSAKPLQP